MAKFRKILLNKNFFLLWLGQIISQFGDRLDQMALIALIYVRAPGSAFQLAKLFAFTIAPVFIIGPIAGVYVDRWDRRRTMYISDFLRAIMVFSIPLFWMNFKSMVPIYIIIFLVFCIGRFFIPAKMSIIPNLVEKEELLAANSLISTTAMIAAGIGLGLGGILVDKIGAKGGFYIDALSFLTSSIMIYLIARKSTLPKYKIAHVSKEIVEVISKSVASELKDGLFYLFKIPKIRLIIALWFTLWAGLGSVYIVSIVFIQQTLKSVTGALGVLATVFCIGLFFGSIVYGKFGQKISAFKAIFASLIAGGLTLGLFASTIQAYPSFLLANIFAVILGIAISPTTIAANTLIHKLTAENMRGKSFSSLEIFGHLAFVIFMLIVSRLAEICRHVDILVTVSIIFSIIGIVGLIRHWKLKDD